ncbi:MAG: hypothetical protein RR190_07645, partial [Bacteroidales bacterium]
GGCIHCPRKSPQPEMLNVIPGILLISLRFTISNDKGLFSMIQFIYIITQFNLKRSAIMAYFLSLA